MSHNETAFLVLWYLLINGPESVKNIPEPVRSIWQIELGVRFGTINEFELFESLVYFLEIGVIKKVYVDRYVYDLKLLKKESTVECVEREDIITKARSHFYFDCFEKVNAKEQKSYYAVLDDQCAINWTNKYISRWLKGNLESVENFLKPKVQVERVLGMLIDAYNKYSGTGYIIERPIDTTLEFTTVLILFCYMKFFTKLEIATTPHEKSALKFIMVFSENFLKKLKITTNNNNNEFFSEICEYFLGTSNKITVKEGNWFEYKKLQYQMKGKEALPSKLIQLLLASKNFCLSWDDVVIHLGTVDREKVKKSLDSFQRNMKRQLLIPKEIRLFSVGDDSIVLNQDLWNV